MQSTAARGEQERGARVLTSTDRKVKSAEGMGVSDEGTANFQGGATGGKGRAEDATEPLPAQSSDKPTSVLNGPEQSKARESSDRTSEASAAEEKGDANDLDLSELKLGEGQAGEDEDG